VVDSRSIDVKQILPSWSESIKWRTELSHKKWWTMNEEVVHEKILRYSNSAMVTRAGRHLDRVKHKSNISGFRGQNICKHYVCILAKGLSHDNYD
jgi:hypothetical protein